MFGLLKKLRDRIAERWDRRRKKRETKPIEKPGKPRGELTLQRRGAVAKYSREGKIANQKGAFGRQE